MRQLGWKSREVRSTTPAWGAPDLETGGTGPVTRLGVRAKHPAANSSTTRGPQGLAGEPGRRRCRTAKGGRRGVGEALLTSAPRNREVSSRKLCPGGGPGHTATAPGGNAP